jgi:hypothetical protein
MARTEDQTLAEKDAGGGPSENETVGIASEAPNAELSDDELEVVAGGRGFAKVELEYKPQKSDT